MKPIDINIPKELIPTKEDLKKGKELENKFKKTYKKYAGNKLADFSTLEKIINETFDKK